MCGITHLSRKLLTLRKWKDIWMYFCASRVRMWYGES